MKSLKYLTWLVTLLLSYSLAGIGVVQAAVVDPLPFAVVNVPLASPLPFTVHGTGKLEYENEVTGEENEYKGLVSCTLNVTMFTPDKLVIKHGSIPSTLRIKAKSKAGTLNISNCIVSGSPVGDSSVTGKVKVTLKNLNLAPIAPTFSEFEASGESEAEGQELKLELDSGFITPSHPVTPADYAAFGALFGPGGAFEGLGGVFGLF